MLMSKQTIKQTTVRTTTKGFKIWLEGNDLTEAGFSVKTPYRIEMKENDIQLQVDPASKRKVTNSKKNGQVISSTIDKYVYVIIKKILNLV